MEVNFKCIETHSWPYNVLQFRLHRWYYQRQKSWKWWFCWRGIRILHCLKLECRSKCNKQETYPQNIRCFEKRKKWRKSTRVLHPLKNMCITWAIQWRWKEENKRGQPTLRLNLIYDIHNNRHLTLTFRELHQSGNFLSKLNLKNETVHHFCLRYSGSINGLSILSVTRMFMHDSVSVCCGLNRKP